MVINKQYLTAIDKLDNLVVIILGSQNSGKSSTWECLFEKENIKTIKKLRSLKLNDGRIDVFLVNGSPEERGVKIEDIITVVQPRIVLCSVQDIPEAQDTLQYFVDRRYFMLIYWLNPGYNQQEKPDYTVNQLQKIIPEETFKFEKRDGSKLNDRVNDIKVFLEFWAKTKNLLYK